MKERIKDIKNKLKENKIFKNVLLILIILLNLFLFLIPNTLINSGLFVFGLFIFLGYFGIYLIWFIKNKKSIKLNKDKKEILDFILNSLLIGIFLNTLFFLILQLFDKNLSYEYTFGNYQAYKNATTITYLIITVLILPLFNNLLLRRLIKKFNTKKSKIIFSIVLSFFVFLTASTYVSGLYLMIISLFLNLYYIEKNSLKETFFIESSIALILSSMTLLLSNFKIILVILMIMICLSVLIKNLKKI